MVGLEKWPSQTKAPEPTKEAFELHVLMAHIQKSRNLLMVLVHQSLNPRSTDGNVTFTLSDVAVLLRPDVRQHSVNAQLLNYPAQCPSRQPRKHLNYMF